MWTEGPRVIGIEHEEGPPSWTEESSLENLSALVDMGADPEWLIPRWGPMRLGATGLFLLATCALRDRLVPQALEKRGLWEPS